MDTRQTSFQLDADTEALVAFLKDRGFGTQTNIIREAIKRMAAQEGLNRKIDFLISHCSAGEFREARWYNDRQQPGNFKRFEYPDGSVAGTPATDPTGPAWPGDENAEHVNSGYRSRFTG